MRGAALAALVACAAIAGCGEDGAPRSRAQRIASTASLIGGPKAIGRIGDYLLENDQIRVIVHDKGAGRGNTLYGGSLIDADLQRPTGEAGGNDQLSELLPSFLLEVMEPTSVDVTADGSDGKAASITVKGTGGDLLQMVALLNTGLLFPSSLDFQQTYTLQPGKRYIDIETTITNHTAGAHQLPYLDPSQLKALGFDVPGIESLQLSVPLGHLVLVGGEQDLFTPGFAGFDVKNKILDTYAAANGFPAFPGMVVDYVATRGKGVSYGLAIPAEASNYVNAFKSLYAPQAVNPRSELISFSFASAIGVFTNNPPTTLAAGESFAFHSYFIIGKGDAASILEAVNEIDQVPTGLFTGTVRDALSSVPLGHASVIVLDAHGDPVTQAETDDGGVFRATLAAGSYSYRVVSADRDTTAPVSFAITVGETTSVRVLVDAPATLAVEIFDELGRAAPSRITVLGTFPGADKLKDPRTFLYDARIGERRRGTAQSDHSTAFIENAFWLADGKHVVTLRPGHYTIVASRGPEYQITEAEVELQAGQTQLLRMQLTRAMNTDGWLAGDFHLHSAPSSDSGLTLVDRVTSAAAEGLEIAAATEHNFIIDYAPTVAALSLQDWLLTLTGLELTTFEMGHFNAYPLKVDPASTRGGEFTWSRQPPQKLFDQLRGPLAAEPGNTIVQVNHPRDGILGYFNQFYIDPESGAPYIPGGISAVFAPYGDEFAPSQFSYDFDAVELVSGKLLEEIHSLRAPDPLPPGPFPDPQPVAGEIVRNADGKHMFPGVAETWFTMLNHGERMTAMGTSDSHGMLFDEPGYGRTMLFVGAGHDTLGRATQVDVIAAIKAHHAVATTAPMVAMTIGDAMIGDDVAVSGPVHVRVEIQAPKWAPVSHLTIWGNGVVLEERAIDESVATHDVETFDFTFTKDTWIVAEVTGTANLFPVVSAIEVPPLDPTVIIGVLSAGLDLAGLTGVPGLKLQRQHPMTPYAITNPIWVDVDGGGFQAPLPSLSARTAPRVIELPRAAPRIDLPGAAPRAMPDVRARFDAIVEPGAAAP